MVLGGGKLAGGNPKKKRVDNCLIYCDPPYKGTTQYSINKNFDYNKFWNWCREMSKKNTVLISEESAPNDFECIWEQPIIRTINTNDRKIKVEKLFKLGSNQQ